MTATLEQNKAGQEVGKPRPRKEDARLVTGETNWTDNITLPGMLHLAFVRSPLAHARITRVDTSAAGKLPGVVAAFSGADFAAEQGSLPCAWPVTDDIVIPDHPPMAVDEVRYVGEAVACVVARDRYTAADALEAIDVDYEPLSPVLDMRSALADDSPRVHASTQSNRSFEWVFSNGDLDAAFRDAAVVIERNYVQQRLIPTAMEPRAVVCSPHGEEFTLWSSTQIPHVLRVMLALVTGIPEQNLRVIAPDVGGGFGSKLQVTAEEVLAVLVARRLRRPVKWTESRSEGNMTVHHGRDQLQRIKIAAERDGRIRGLSVDLLADMGAYLMLVTPGVPLLGAFMFNGIYKMDAYAFRCTGVFTTKIPTDAYRGAGRPEATFGIERIMDELANELGVDPLELRERNWIAHEEFPYTTIAGLTYDSGNYEAATAKAAPDLRLRRAAQGADGAPCERRQGPAWHRRVHLHRDVRARAVSGARPALLRGRRLGARLGADAAHGQGRGGHRLERTRAGARDRMEPDRRGRARRAVRGRAGAARRHPGVTQGHGHLRLAVAGGRRHGGTVRLRQGCGQGEGHRVQDARGTPGGQWSSAAGCSRPREAESPGKTIQEIALAAFAAHDLPDGVEPSLDSDATFDPQNFSFPHGTHLCATEVDTETGQVKIRSYVAVDDVGRVVNPAIVEGQVHGGIAQGIGQALYEEAVYDADGQPADDHHGRLPAAVGRRPACLRHRQDRDALHHESTRGQGRRRGRHHRVHPGSGERRSGRAAAAGVRDVTMPCSPERVWRAIREGTAR